MSIKDELSKSNIYTYSKLTKDKLTSVLHDMFYNRTYQRDITLYTGWLGMVIYNLATLGLKMNINLVIHVASTSKVRGLMYYFSLFKKSGNIKVKVVRKHDVWTFDCYNNTSYLFSCTELNEVIIKLLKSLTMENETKQFTNAELLEKRQWVRENFIPGVDDVDPTWHKVMKDEATTMANEVHRDVDDVTFNDDEY